MGAYVEQQVSTLARCADEQAEQCLGALVVLVNELVTPHAVHCLTCLKWQAADFLAAEAGLVLAWNVTLEYLDVLTRVCGIVVVVTDEARWLEFVDERVLLVELPVEWGWILVTVPLSVEPDGADFTIVCEQLGQLLIHEVVVCRPVLVLPNTADDLLAGTSHWVLVARPVNVRVVEVQLDALLVALVGKLLEHVAAEWCGVNDVVFALLCVPH